MVNKKDNDNHIFIFINGCPQQPMYIFNGQQKDNDKDNNLFYLYHWTTTHQVQRQQ